MALELGEGFRPYLLRHISTIAKMNTPEYKLEPVGFLNLLQSQSKPEILRLNDPNGHKKQVRIKKQQRFNKSQTDTAKSCDNFLQPTYSENDVDLSSVRQLAFSIPDEKIAKYEEDASRTVMLGQPPTKLMNEFFQTILTASSAILEGVNDDLLTLAVGQIGVNRRTGNNNAATINLGKDSNVLPLDNGETQILADFKNNGGKGRPQVVGSGLMYNYLLQQIAKSPNQSGFDTRIMANMMNFYHDLSAASILGANQVIVYEPDAVQIVEYMEYTGFKAGPKPGASTFFTAPLPMFAGEEAKPVEFDFQLKYFDCPTVLTDAYYGTEFTMEKGFGLIISKQCGLWTIPSAAYRATDVLNGNRGSLRYTITNSCDVC